MLRPVSQQCRERAFSHDPVAAPKCTLLWTGKSSHGRGYWSADEGWTARRQHLLGALKVPGRRRGKGGRGRNRRRENKEQPQRMDENHRCYALIETVLYEQNTQDCPQRRAAVDKVLV